MKILVIGGGGREHALVWKLKQSSSIDRIFCAGKCRHRRDRGEHCRFSSRFAATASIRKTE